MGIEISSFKTQTPYFRDFLHLLSGMAATPYKQDLPPKGGYAPINYKRIPARSVLNAPIIFGGLFSSMAYGIWSYKRGMRAYHKVVGTVVKQQVTVISMA